MKPGRGFLRLFSLLLAAALCLTALPGAVFAVGEENVAYTRISTMEELVSGEYVLVASSGYALGRFDGEMEWVTAVQPVVEGDAVTDPAGGVWTLTVTDSGVILRDSTGAAIAPLSEEDNGLEAGAYGWCVSLSGGSFFFRGKSGEMAVVLAQNGTSGFRAYDEGIVNGSYPSSFTLYKRTAAATEPEETQPADPEPTETEPEDTEPTETKPAETQPEETGPEDTPQGPVISPGEYVIWDRGSGMALSSRRMGGDSAYYSGVAVTEAEGVLSGYSNRELWTVTAEDGVLTITCGSEKLGMGDAFLSVSHGDGYTEWIAEDGGNGCIYLKNAVRACYLRYDAQLQFWTSVQTAAQASALQLTAGQRQEEPEEPETKETTAAVVITPAGGEFFIKDQAVTITLTCETEGAEIYYATTPEGEFCPYEEPLVLETGFESFCVRAYAQKEGWEPSGETEQIFTELVSRGEGLYFGQLHIHSSLSDHTVSAEEGFSLAAETEDMDFFAVTDHSNSFDNDETGDIGQDGALVSQDWAEGKEAAREATDWDFVGIYGYEMAWEDGKKLGHLSTFFTPGFQSRDQEAYADYATALPHYYEALATVEGAVAQFNHPGTEFGDFQGFDHYSESADKAITLLELGEEMDITYYIRALDKGWHVAPTYYQDGYSIGEGRTAVFAETLTERGIAEALSGYQVYATQDSDLAVIFTLDDYPMGTMLEKRDVGNTVTICAEITDPTDEETEVTVEVITDGGVCVAEEKTENERISFALPAQYQYYFLRITQADGDVAVTAPVWVDTVENVGISRFAADTALPVQGQMLNLSLTLYNSENCNLDVESITLFVDGEAVYTTEEAGSVAAGGTADYTFPYTHSGLGYTAVRVRVTAVLDGAQRTYQQEITLNFRRQDMVVQILVDGTHGSVPSLKNLTALAAEEQINVVVERSEITAEMLGKSSILIVPAPEVPFADSFLELVRDFEEAGGSVVVCGQSDSLDTQLHSSEELNRLLSVLGVSLRIRDDQARDTENNGGTDTWLYFSGLNTASAWLVNGNSNQVYRQWDGCTVDAGSGTWLVKGYRSTDSTDADGDGRGGVSRGDVVVLACEETGHGGTVFAAGGLFLGDEETGEPKNIWDEPYANRTILKNLLGSKQVELPLNTIRDVREGQQGEVYRVRGYVTAGTSDPNNTFPDTIYLQDDTGGIAIVPFDEGGIEIGTPMEVVGYLDTQGGNQVLEVIAWEVLSYGYYRYAPETIPNKTAMDYEANGGELLQIEGKVVSLVRTADRKGIAQIVLKDDNGDLATVLIEDGIFSGSTGKNTLASEIKKGRSVRAMGILHVSSDGTLVLRVRNCDEVVWVTPNPYTGDNPDTGDKITPYLAALPLSLAALVLLIGKRRRK